MYVLRRLMPTIGQMHSLSRRLAVSHQREMPAFGVPAKHGDEFAQVRGDGRIIAEAAEDQ